MNEKDRRERLYVSQQGEKLRKGHISRREFLRRAALAGFGFSAAGLMRMSTARAAVPQPIVASGLYDYGEDVKKWLKDVGGKFKGTTIRIASESTAPSQITSD